MGIETVIEGIVCVEAEADGWLVKKLKFAGERGAPDRLFAKEGRVVFIEFKSPGKRANTSTGQNRVLRELKAAGIECYTVENQLAAYRILGVQR